MAAKPAIAPGGRLRGDGHGMPAAASPAPPRASRTGPSASASRSPASRPKPIASENAARPAAASALARAEVVVR